MVYQWVDQNVKVTDDATMSTIVDDIVPKDSISNVQSQHSSRSSRSSVVSLKMRLETEQSEITAKAKRLKRKQ